MGLLGTEREPMDWGTTPDSVRPYLPPGARIEVVKGTGHFIHVEKPHESADLVLDFLSS